MTRVGEALLWWLVLCAAWAATLPAFSAAELVVGALAAVPCALVAGAARRATDGRWRVRRRWLRWLLPLPAAIAVGSVRVLAAPLRRSGSGRVREIPLHPDPDGPTADAHRALATIVASMDPTTVVVDSRPEGHALVVHAITGGGDRLDEAVRR